VTVVATVVPTVTLSSRQSEDNTTMGPSQALTRPAELSTADATRASAKS
jgi:hypothetical protein